MKMVPTDALKHQAQIRAKSAAFVVALTRLASCKSGEGLRSRSQSTSVPPEALHGIDRRCRNHADSRSN